MFIFIIQLARLIAISEEWIKPHPQALDPNSMQGVVLAHKSHEARGQGASIQNTHPLHTVVNCQTSMHSGKDNRQLHALSETTFSRQDTSGNMQLTTSQN